ncbi:four helix bundle protein [Parafilimonas sp.]|uniref:four helix bundle protein n=1 Tax=Parafilimonas sp. TaxID=1969739 RepID=UPI0039E575A4
MSKRVLAPLLWRGVGVRSNIEIQDFKLFSRTTIIRFLIYAQSECDETILHLEFLFETNSLKDTAIFNQPKQDYEALSKRINKFIQWVEDNWNDFQKPETGNK